MAGHLLHVGFAKAGSTFLQRWFDAHPQLAYRTAAIGGFRDTYDITAYGAAAGEEVAYHVTSDEAFCAPRVDARAMAIDYERPRELGVLESQRKVCSLLATLFPNATVLIVTRGFRSMIFSSVSQYARSGGDRDIAEVLAAMQKERPARFTEAWDYDAVIAAYSAAFGAGNVIVMPYESLRDDPAAFTATLAARLGIEPLSPSPDRVNESLSPPELYWYPRLTRAVRRLPSKRLYQMYVAAALGNRLRQPIAMLQRLRPGTPVTADAVPDDLVNEFRGKAESLRGNPLYVRYAAEYLHDAR